MRTARYNNYTILKIFLLVMVIVLGLFVYLKFVKAPLEHVAADDAWVTVDATCTADGYRYKVCTECGEHFDNETLRSTGHTPLAAVKEDEKPHTKTEGGSYESVVYCEDCGVEISRETVMVGGTHTVNIIEIKENVVEATCAAGGSYDTVEICEGCELVFEDTRKTVTVYALGHNITDAIQNVVDPTCTEKGSYDAVKLCDVCGHEESRETNLVEALGHIPVEKTENEIPSTCTEKGSCDKVTYCSVCDEELSRQTVVLEISHNFPIIEEIINFVDPTCTEAGGFDTITYCSGCEEILTNESSVIEPLGHNYVWELVFVKGELTVIGVCDADECAHVCDQEAENISFDIEQTDDNASCAKDKEKIYEAKVYQNGELIATDTLVVIDSVGSHKISDGNGGKIDVTELAKVREDGVIYYNVSTFGIQLVYTKADGQTTTEAKEAAWDENGYAYGVFKCADCDTWVAVVVYNDLAD